jgi:hypothetical protein
MISHASKDPDESLPFNDRQLSRLLDVMEITMMMQVTIPIILTASTS